MALPVLPMEVQSSSLQERTRTFLAGHAFRARARVPEEPLGVTLTPWSLSAHGLSFLVHVWMHFVQSHEHLLIFGPQAETVEGFIRAYQASEIVVLHETGQEWWHDHGLLGLAYFDDVDGQARARIHHAVLPAYRHPEITQGLATLVLRWAFEQRGWAMLYGLTPAAHPPARRFAKRMGFRMEPEPWLMTIQGQVVSGLRSLMTREQWAAREGR